MHNYFATYLNKDTTFSDYFYYLCRRKPSYKTNMDDYHAENFDL